MAKNIVSVDVVADSKGSFKKVGLEARGTAKDLNAVAGSSASADRNLKGAAQASSNATKNFSKMSQGMGGLVAAYATVAAQIFALSAAYRFLLEAADFRILLEGQRALTASTGVAYASITRSIQKATSAQLGYKEAAQAAAISTAAGLSGDQIVRLSKLADTISKTLGRDIEDSFSRLVRGITKAEPELLDELGIILRLKEAQEQYALTVGKSASALTSFERSQAVYLFTVEQGEQKFGALGDSLSSSTNKIRQLGVALQEVSNTIKPVISAISEFVAGALTQNITATITAFGLLAGGVLRQLLPSIVDIQERYSSSLEQLKKKREAYNKTLQESALNEKILSRMKGREVEGAREAIRSINTETRVARTAQGIQVPISKTMQKLAAGQLDVNSKAFKKFAQDVKNELMLLEQSKGKIVTRMKSQFIGMTKEQVLAVKTAVGIMIGDYSTLEAVKSGVLTGLQKTEQEGKKLGTGLVAVFTKGAEKVATFGLRLLSVLGWIGLAVTVFQLLSAAVSFLSDKIKLGFKEDSLKPLSERLTSLSDQAKTLIQDFEKMQEKADSFSIRKMAGELEFFGNAAAALPVDELTDRIGRLQAELASLETATGVLENIAPNIPPPSLEELSIGALAGVGVSAPMPMGAPSVYDFGSEAFRAGTKYQKERLDLIAQESVEIYGLQAAYAKLIPGQESYAETLTQTADSIQRSIKLFKEDKIGREEFRDVLRLAAIETKKANETILTSAQVARAARAAFNQLQQSVKTYNDRIRGTISLTEIQESYSQLSQIVASYNETVQALPTYINEETAAQLVKLADAYKTTAIAVKGLYDQQQRLVSQKIGIENRKKELDLIQGTSVALVRLRAQQERDTIAFRREEVKLERERIKTRLQELRATTGLDIDAEALSNQAGRTIVSAAETQAILIEKAIKSAADYHARNIAQAITGRSIEDLEARGNSGLAKFLRMLSAAEEAAAAAKAADEKPDGARPVPTASAVSEINIEGLSTSNAILISALNAEFQNLAGTIAGIDIEILGSQIKEAYDVFERESEALDRELLTLDPLRTIVGAMQESVEKSRLLLELAEDEENIERRRRSLLIERNRGVSELLSSSSQLQATQEEIANNEIKQLEVQDGLNALARQALEADKARLEIAEKYNKLNQERQIQEKFLSLSAGSYADGARESFAVAAATNEVNQAAEEIQVRQLRIQQLQAQAAVSNNAELRAQIIAEQTKLKTQAESYALLVASLEVLKEQVSVVYKIGEAAKSALGEGLTKEFADFLKGGMVDVEKSFLTILQGVGNAVADQMAKMLSDSVMDIMGMGPKAEEQKAIERANQLEEALKRGGDYVAQQISSAFPSSIPGANSIEEIDLTKLPRRSDSVQEAANQLENTLGTKSPFLTTMKELFSEQAPWLKGMLGGLAGAVGAFAMSALGGGGGSKNAWTNAIVGGLISGATMGFNSWLGGLGSAASKTASVTAAGAAKMKAVQSGLTTKIDNIVASSIAQKANGGYFSGGFQAFAKGGTVKEPTLGLVGEGKYNEAIVPLPDGRSIPVIMQGSGGDRTNVGINININSSGQTQTDSRGQGDRGVAMAQALSAVVQQEIKRQKRPGGLLSPY